MICFNLIIQVSYRYKIVVYTEYKQAYLIYIQLCGIYIWGALAVYQVTDMPMSLNIKIQIKQNTLLP